MSRFSSPPPSFPERVSRHFSTTTPTPPQESRAIPNFPWAKLRLFFSAFSHVFLRFLSVFCLLFSPFLSLSLSRYLSLVPTFSVSVSFLSLSDFNDGYILFPRRHNFQLFDIFFFTQKTGKKMPPRGSQTRI